MCYFCLCFSVSSSPAQTVIIAVVVAVAVVVLLFTVCVVVACKWRSVIPVIMPSAVSGHFGIVRSVRLSVPWRSCLGYRHAGCLQLNHRRPPEMCRLRTSPRTDAIFGSDCQLRGAYRLAAPSGRYLLNNNKIILLSVLPRPGVSCRRRYLSSLYFPDIVCQAVVYAAKKLYLAYAKSVIVWTFFKLTDSILFE